MGTVDAAYGVLVYLLIGGRPCDHDRINIDQLSPELPRGIPQSFNVGR